MQRTIGIPSGHRHRLILLLTLTLFLLTCSLLFSLSLKNPAISYSDLAKFYRPNELLIAIIEKSRIEKKNIDDEKILPYFPEEIPALLGELPYTGPRYYTSRQRILDSGVPSTYNFSWIGGWPTCEWQTLCMYERGNKSNVYYAGLFGKANNNNKKHLAAPDLS